MLRVPINCTADMDRVANLLQSSCAFGKVMERVDSVGVAGRCWDYILRPLLVMMMRVSSLTKAIADGYPFPTNLDHRPPAPSGLAPESEQDVLRRGL